MLSRVRSEVLRDVLPSPDAVQIWDRGPAGSPQRLAWLPSWLPLGIDVMGGLLFADLRAGPLHGAVRSFFRDSGAGDRFACERGVKPPRRRPQTPPHLERQGQQLHAAA
ncbi:hypothetical protein ABT369_09050 [Dactylosporangium sp. NPDC000244]|uniref:hypothetical protein n=1 Tax=Dactylosporangium sp. NPDC000244 TaxID=3154365 RepID=UPI00331C0CF5